jgi:uncharacterized protein YqcC (DUF446 family)
MPDRQQQLLRLIGDAEREMRLLALWTDQAPTAEKLASRMPFCCDTLFFPEWLQWVFIPRLALLLGTEQRLPHKCEIYPLAEEWLRVEGLLQESGKLLGIIRELDEVLSNSLEH